MYFQQFSLKVPHLYLLRPHLSKQSLIGFGKWHMTCTASPVHIFSSDTFKVRCRRVGTLLPSNWSLTAVLLFWYSKYQVIGNGLPASEFSRREKLAEQLVCAYRINGAAKVGHERASTSSMLSNVFPAMMVIGISSHCPLPRLAAQSA